MSSTPSPVTSPVATFAPPVNPSNGTRVNRRLASALNTFTRTGVPGPVATANRSVFAAGGGVTIDGGVTTGGVTTGGVTTGGVTTGGVTTGGGSTVTVNESVAVCPSASVTV